MTAAEFVARAVADGDFTVLAEAIPYMRTLGIAVRPVGSGIVVMAMTWSTVGDWSVMVKAG